MHLTTAIVPPRHVLDEVAAAVQAACLQASPSTDERSARRPRGLSQRMRHRSQSARRAAPVSSSQPLPQLDLTPVDSMSLPVAGFGNVTTDDSTRLTAALKMAAAETPNPIAHFAGGAALEFDGDRCVWVRLAGEVDAFKQVARGITQAVEQLGFYVDRRRFRPMLAVATVTNATTGPYLQAVVDALETFAGQPWAVDQVHLMRLSYGPGPEAQELDRLPLHP